MTSTHQELVSVLSYETANSFEWVTCGAGGGGAFTSGSGLTTLDTATDLVGIGTSTPTAKLAVVGDGGMTSPLFRLSSSTNEILFEVLADGSLDVNSGALYYDVATNQTSIERLQLGNVEFEQNAGAVSWIDLSASGTPVGTVQSYTAQIDSSPLLTIYGESDGSTGVQNLRVGIGTTSPTGYFSVNGEVYLASTTPSITANSLYNLGGTLLLQW